MGTITAYIDTNTPLFPNGPAPNGGATSNALGTFTYNGINYRMYRLFANQPAGTTINAQVTAC